MEFEGINVYLENGYLELRYLLAELRPGTFLPKCRPFSTAIVLHIGAHDLVSLAERFTPFNSRPRASSSPSGMIKESLRSVVLTFEFDDYLLRITDKEHQQYLG